MLQVYDLSDSPEDDLSDLDMNETPFGVRRSQLQSTCCWVFLESNLSTWGQVRIDSLFVSVRVGSDWVQVSIDLYSNSSYIPDSILFRTHRNGAKQAFSR